MHCILVKRFNVRGLLDLSVLVVEVYIFFHIYSEDCMTTYISFWFPTRSWKCIRIYIYIPVHRLSFSPELDEMSSPFTQGHWDSLTCKRSKGGCCFLLLGAGVWALTWNPPQAAAAAAAVMPCGSSTARGASRVQKAKVTPTVTWKLHIHNQGAFARLTCQEATGCSRMVSGCELKGPILYPCPELDF